VCEPIEVIIRERYRELDTLFRDIVSIELRDFVSQLLAAFFETIGIQLLNRVACPHATEIKTAMLLMTSCQKCLLLMLCNCCGGFYVLDK
jgi:hypothetical protein